MVVKRQGSGTLFSAHNDNDSQAASSRISRAHRRLNNSDFMNSAAGSGISSPSVHQAKPAAGPSGGHRVRQFDQIQAPFSVAKSPPGSSMVKKETQMSFHSSQQSQSGFKNPKTKGIKLYPGEASRW